jgi:hypothetical protein
MRKPNLAGEASQLFHVVTAVEQILPLLAAAPAQTAPRTAQM